MPAICILKEKLLSDNYFVLRDFTYQINGPQGKITLQHREVYDRGNGATVLLYNRDKGTVVLTRQFRVATWLNGNPDGMLIESCAGLLDNLDPESCARNEAMEETGYQVAQLEKVFELYMSPGGVTERIYCYLAEYDDTHHIGQGGGVEDEEIEVIELPFRRAMEMVNSGEIRDGKTIILLQHLALQGRMNSALASRAGQ